MYFYSRHSAYFRPRKSANTHLVLILKQKTAKPNQYVYVQYKNKE